MTVEEICTETFGDFIKEFQILERQETEKIFQHRMCRQCM
jgi:hypothetical protein